MGPDQRVLVSDRKYRDLGEFFEDRFGGSGPYERSTIVVVGVDVACDRVVQIIDGMEGSASDPAARDGGEEALDGVEPGGRCRREMERPVRMIGEPFENLGLSMSTEPGPQICMEQGPLMEALWGSARLGEAGLGCAGGASADR